MDYKDPIEAARAVLSGEHQQVTELTEEVVEDTTLGPDGHTTEEYFVAEDDSIEEASKKATNEDDEDDEDDEDEEDKVSEARHNKKNGDEDEDEEDEDEVEEGKLPPWLKKRTARTARMARTVRMATTRKKLTKKLSLMLTTIKPQMARKQQMLLKARSE